MVSCKKSKESPISERQFQNKTFSLIDESEEDTLFIEFQDSTYQIFGNFWQGENPWRISHYDNTNFLVLENRAIGIQQISEDKFNCTYIGLTDYPLELVERKPKWDTELLNGTWVEQTSFENYHNDSILKPPPVPKPPAPEGFKESDYQDLPLYKISGDSIYLAHEYLKVKSKIQLNNTGEFITMNLKNYALGYRAQENFWRIKYLTDSIMIIDKISYELLYTEHDKKLTNITMVKKR